MLNQGEVADFNAFGEVLLFLFFLWEAASLVTRLAFLHLVYRVDPQESWRTALSVASSHSGG